MNTDKIIAEWTVYRLNASMLLSVSLTPSTANLKFISLNFSIVSLLNHEIKVCISENSL